MMRLFIFSLLAAAALCAQDRIPPVGAERKPQVYVRPFSIGATLSVLGLKLMPDKSVNTVTASPAVDGLYTTTGGSQRVGYGLTAQASLTERFAVNIGFFLRRTGYKMNGDVYRGTDNTSTSADERTHVVTNEDTQARFYDVPVTLRYHTKDRHDEGPRFFLEGGAALRRVSRIRTSIDTTVNSGTTECCDTTAANPARRTVRGFVGGLGVQLIDPVGIRVIPQVRYTRWMNQTFSSFSSFSQRNQVEGMISLTF